MYNGDILISKGLSVCDAMRQLEKTDVKLLLVMDGEVLVGTLTDGDIRRYLFRGGKIEDTVDKAAEKNPRVARNEKEAAELYNRNYYIAIPIVSGKGVLLDVYIGGERQETEKIHRQIDVPVIINAGGRGTRLDPFTRVLPKPLIPVGDLPIIEHIMQRFEKYGCKDFGVIVNYKKELIRTYFNEAENSYSIRWYDEIKPLGTGGGISLLKGLDRTFFFINCDTLLLSDYDSILSFHRENGNAITMICAWKSFTIPYGVVDMGKNGAIEKMREKPELSFLTNTGMYIIEPEVIDDVPEDTSITLPEIVSLEMQKGRKVAAYPVAESEWLDMGQMSELEKMRERLYGK